MGGSVARARDARVSIMRFTQSIWTAFKGESCRRRRRGQEFNVHNFHWGWTEHVLVEVVGQPERPAHTTED